jgi:hypothetical protein
MSSTTAYTPSSPPTRRPYHGSCHCGNIRFIVFISMPPAALGDAAHEIPSVRFYKCNCTPCHKMGYFHIRVPDAPRDFYLLSPLDEKALSDYQCSDRELHWRFCKTCGVRCFIFKGESEVVDVDLEKEMGKESEGKMTKVWRCKPEGWKEGRTSYLSVNALTIEGGQDGFDLREMVDKKWVAYLDCKDYKEEHRFNYPQVGGTW